MNECHMAWFDALATIAALFAFAYWMSREWSGITTYEVLRLEMKGGYKYLTLRVTRKKPFQVARVEERTIFSESGIYWIWLDTGRWCNTSDMGIRDLLVTEKARQAWKAEI